MKPCFGYIRVSTQKQGEGVSLEAQQEAIQAFASRSNLTITRWFEEKETAAKSGRPIFNSMLKLLRRRAAAGLVMHKIDRSARNLRDWAAISELSDAGIDVYFPTETLDFRSRGGRLTADIQAVIAADYIRNLREETKKGLDGRLRQGLYPFHAPLGYLDQGGGQVKTLCPVRAPQVRRMFELYASGQYSYRALLAKMTAEGLTNLRGRALTVHGIESILRNPFYCGIMEVRKTGKRFKCKHAPLITAETFRRVEAVRHGKVQKRSTRHNYLYRGLFRCALCRTSMIPERQKGRVYYRCQSRLCPTKTVREDVLDAAVEAALSKLALKTCDQQWLQNEWQRSRKRQDPKDSIRSLDLRIAQTQARRERLTDLLIDGSFTQETHADKARHFVLELASLSDQRQKVIR